MIRFLFLFCCLFHPAYSATPESRVTTQMEFTATVEKLTASNRQAVAELYRNGTIHILADPDARFVLALRIARTDAEIVGLAAGATLVLGIHSPTLLFAPTEASDAVGRTFRFRMKKSVSDGKASFASLQATIHETP
jgi:hypothetical protein